MSVCQLVPLLQLLYHAPDGGSHHLNYMALIIMCVTVCVCLYACLCMTVCQLVPLLQLLYQAPDGGSHHLNYMALIVILILSEDACFSKSVHEIVSCVVICLKHYIVVFSFSDRQHQSYEVAPCGFWVLMHH